MIGGPTVPAIQSWKNATPQLIVVFILSLVTSLRFAFRIFSSSLSDVELYRTKHTALLASLGFMIVIACNMGKSLEANGNEREKGCCQKSDVCQVCAIASI